MRMIGERMPAAPLPPNLRVSPPREGAGPPMGAVPPMAGRFPKDGPSAPGSTHTTPRSLTQPSGLESRGSWSAHSGSLPALLTPLHTSQAERCMVLPPLDPRNAQSPWSLPGRAELPVMSSRRGRESIAQIAQQLDDLRRQLEAAVIGTDIVALRSSIAECEPLDKLVKALAAAKAALAEAEEASFQAASPLPPLPDLTEDGCPQFDFADDGTCLLEIEELASLDGRAASPIEAS